MIVTGKVTKLVSKPTRGFQVQPPGDPPPPTVEFADVSVDDLTVAAAAYVKGSDVDVQTASPPACGGVTAK